MKTADTQGKHHHGHHHGHHHHHHDEPISQEEAVQSLLVLGQVALNASDYESAVQAYASVLKLEQNETAAYNLGSLYARGLAVRRDYVEAARLFHQAELLGNERAGKLCAKCMFDFVREGIDHKTPADLYAAMAVFVERVYPEATDQKLEAAHGLVAIANTQINKSAYDEAAKVLRAAAEFANDGYAQYYLATLYRAGIGVQRNDLAALYWLDRAVDSGAADQAQNDLARMLGSYSKNLSAEEFRATMAKLADWCEKGTPDVPACPSKVAHWRELEPSI